MDADAAAFAVDSGSLARVTGHREAAGRYKSLSFEFSEGVIRLWCSGDTDEIVVGIGASASEEVEITDAWVEGLLGSAIDYAWEVRDHRGYHDAFQLRFINRESDEKTRQFEFAASVMSVQDVRTAPV